MWWLWLGVGLTVGTAVGVLLAGLLAGAKHADALAVEQTYREVVRAHHDPMRACRFCMGVGRPDLADLS